jgi:competence protein ComGF
MKALNMFSGSIETFNLMPVLFAIILLIVILLHFGIFMVLMDRRKQIVDVEDEDRWWEKWDMT